MRMILICLATVLVCTAAFAYPSFTGPSGLVTLPSPKIVPEGQFVVGLDYHALAGGDAYPAHVTYGLGRAWELSGGYDVQSGNDEWAANLKYRLPSQYSITQGALSVALPSLPSVVPLGPYASTVPSSASVPQVNGIIEAVGVQALGGGVQGRIEEPYFTASHAFTTGSDAAPLVVVTGGVNWTRMQTFDTEAWRGFLGASLSLRGGSALSAEYQSRNSHLLFDAKPLTALALRYPIGNGIATQVGITNADGVSGGAQQKLFAGASFAFGGRKNTTANTVTIPLSRTQVLVKNENGDVSVIPIAQEPYGSLTMPKWW